MSGTRAGEPSPRPSFACGSAAPPPALPYGDLESFACSANSSTLLFAFDVGVFAWRSDFLRPVAVGHARISARTLALNARGTHALLVDYDNASLWFVELNDEGERRHRRIPCDELLDLHFDVSAAVSPDGRHVAIATTESGAGQLLVLPWGKAKPRAAIATDARFGLSFSPDGAHVIAGAERASRAFSLDGRPTGVAPTCFAARDGAAWCVDDEAPHVVHFGRWTAGETFAWTPIGRRAVGNLGESVDLIAPNAKGDRALVIGAVAADDAGGIASAAWVVDDEARQLCTLACPCTDDGLFEAYGRVGWSPCGARVFIHAEAPLIEGDDPVACVLVYDAHTGAWLGVLSAVQRADDEARIGGAGADPFGLEGDDLGDVAFGARRTNEGPPIAFGPLGTRLLAQTVDGVYGAADGRALHADALDPFDQGAPVCRYLLGRDAERSFALMPAAAAPTPTLDADPRDIEEAADEEITRLEDAGYGLSRAEDTAPDTPWWWMLLGGLLIAILAWWLA